MVCMRSTDALSLPQSFALHRLLLSKRSLIPSATTHRSWNISAPSTSWSLFHFNSKRFVSRFTSHLRRHLCGYDLNLTYPQQGGHFPTLARPSAVDPASPWFYTGSTSPFYFSQNLRFHAQAKLLALAKVGKNVFIRDTLKKRYVGDGGVSRLRLSKRDVERELKREVYKRDLSLRTNDTIDPWYACNLLEELYDYAVNFTFPWSMFNYVPLLTNDLLTTTRLDTGEDEEALNVRPSYTQFMFIIIYSSHIEGVRRHGCAQPKAFGQCCQWQYASVL